ncbi:MAG: hypothetical protein GF398_00850 [Chitinivibrionales bacterium]|nr:hypothetical protein [Chitinivibrionales bacterium]
MIAVDEIPARDLIRMKNAALAIFYVQNLSEDEITRQRKQSVSSLKAVLKSAIAQENGRIRVNSLQMFKNHHSNSIPTPHAGFRAAIAYLTGSGIESNCRMLTTATFSLPESARIHQSIDQAEQNS